ncbi:hypothetical protein SAPIO_CDS0453 [Scedosporium apiospermum]|uniref:C2H2-type domain-containing protein n=1 Tax=Pseudallescheria apiosperma TaxID=563466 RepID=A0A084GH16_PSEDA|nr:uncharacterized protein SAPIO_CDS0453 [Scedosporium apiospermum]KEZ46628.1 hypothetical protein SAPIO_CDS0453 [Scedosporium apiospermum]
MLVTPTGLQPGQSDPAPTRKLPWSLTDDDMFLLRSTPLTFFTAVIDEIRKSLRILGVATLPRVRDLCTHKIIGGSKLLSSFSCSIVKLLGTRPSRDMTVSLLLHYYVGVANVIRDTLSRLMKGLLERVDPILEMALTIPRVSRALTRGWLGLGKKNQDHQIWLIVRLLTTFSLLVLYVLPDIFQAWFKKRFKSVSVSMPWSIPPALLVLWSVVWMFYDRPPTEDFQLDDFDFFHGSYYDDLPGVNFDDASLSLPETILAPATSPVAFLAAPDVHHMTQDPLPQLVAVQNNIVPLIETYGNGQRSPDNPPSQYIPRRTNTEHTPTPQRNSPKGAGAFTCASCKTSFTRKDNLDRHVNKKTCRPRAESQVVAQSPATEPGTPPFSESRGNSRGVKRAREGTPVEEEGGSVDKELKKLRKMLDEERAGRRRAEEQVDKLLDIIKDLSKERK